MQPLALPLISALVLVALGVGSILCFALSFIAWRRRSTPGGTGLAVLLTAVAIWALFYALEITAAEVADKIVWAKVQYLGITITPIAWLVFAFRYTGHGTMLRRRALLLFFLLPLFTIALVATNEQHHLVWTSIEVGVGGLPTLDIGHGPWFWVHVVCSYLCLLGGSWALLRPLRQHPGVYGRQTVALVVAVAAPWLANVAYILGIRPVPGLDPTPFAFLIVGGAIGWGVFRLSVLDLVIGLAPLARDAVVESMADGVIVVDSRRQVVDVNPAAARLLDTPLPGLIGRDAAAVLPAVETLYGADQPTGERETESASALIGGARARAEATIRNTSGTHHVAVTLSTIGATSANSGRFILLRDITQQKRAMETLAWNSMHDALTQLPNRERLLAKLDEALSAARASGGECAVVTFDINRFREINEAFGHAYGDRIIAEVARRLTAAVPPGSAIARLAGDEFGVILPATGVTGALGISNDVARALGEPCAVDGFRLDLTVCAGIATFPEHAESASDLLRRADLAMNAAKRAGVGVAVYSAEHDPQSAKRLAMLADLRSAIENGTLTLHYQPQLDCRTERVERVEALVRWRHPTLGNVPPDRFIPMAEQTGLIHPLTDLVLRQALAQNRKWHQAGRRLQVSVNLSAKTLSGTMLQPSSILALLAAHDLPATALKVEVTESCLMADQARARAFLSLLRAGGVTGSVDDFGTGYSSLAYLARLPIDEIKIDKAFIRNITSDAGDRAIVRSTINLAHDLGYCVVAEGVEDLPALRTLMDLGCDFIQGYYVARPLPADDLTRWLTQPLPPLSPSAALPRDERDPGAERQEDAAGEQALHARGPRAVAESLAGGAN